MSKASLLIPVLTAVSALALVFNSAFLSDEKRKGEKSIIGTVVKADASSIEIDTGKEVVLAQFTSETAIYLNERPISAHEIGKGRKAKLNFRSVKDKAIAQVVDVFPTADDFHFKTGTT